MVTAFAPAGFATGTWRVRWRRQTQAHPALGAAVVVVGSWLALFLDAATRRDPSAGMPGMAQHRSLVLAVLAGLPYWAVMSVAMMGPAAIPGVRHTAVNSLRWRRRRAMAEFSAGYLAVWLLDGVVVLAVLAALPQLRSTALLAVVLGAAAVWQLGVWKRRFLRDCHRTVVLPLRGWRAERAAWRFGWRSGVACLGSCWLLMLVMALAMVIAPALQLAGLAALTIVVTAERLSRRPLVAVRLSAWAMVLASAMVLQLALA